MGDSGSSEAVLYSEYRAEVEGLLLTRALRRAVIVLCVVQTVFILVDWIVYPEQFWSFLPTRLGLNVILAAIYCYTSKRYPLASSFATCFAGGAMLFIVVIGTGGASSEYYVGLVLLFIGIGVLAPLSARQGGAAIGVLFSVYVAIQVFQPDGASIESRALSLFFLTAAAFEGVMCCGYLDRMRFGDFRQRRELEHASEELKALDQEKSRFTANVHHELRTPLALILAPIDEFLEGNLGGISEKQTDYLETMRSSGQRLHGLINNLLDLAKIEGEQLAIRRKEMDVGLTVKDLLDAARPLAHRKGVGLFMDRCENSALVYVDPEALQKILLNLIGNSLKFSATGGEIHVGCHSEIGGGVEISVMDEGVGIDSNEIERVFKRFAQVDSSSTRRHEGTGIGLSLAKELVELHGGRIWAESAGLGRGATFRFSLPAGAPDDEAPESVLHSMNGLEASLDDSFSMAFRELGGGTVDKNDVKFHEMERDVQRSMASFQPLADVDEALNLPSSTPVILVVEDNAEMRRLLRGILSREFKVREARNGKEGLEMVRSVAPDLVLTDVMMPEMSGTELCREIKSDECLAHIPVVLVTSKAESEMKVRGLEMGADDYVTKPFHPRELLARTRTLVRIHSLQGALSSQNEVLAGANTDLEAALRELKEASSRLAHAERLAAVGELAAGIAHEINNPVNFASNALRALRVKIQEVLDVVVAVERSNFGNLDRWQEAHSRIKLLLEKSDLTKLAGTIEELIDIATEGLDRTHRLVGDLRDFAAPKGGANGLVDLGAALDATVKLLSHSLRERDVSVVLRVASDLPMIHGDLGAIGQVFLNLIKNAAEAIGCEGGVVEIEMSEKDGEIVASVSDNGPGVVGDAVGKLFDPFFTTKGAGHGTGMGLAISQRIAAEHGGTLSLGSKRSEGATFILRIPVANYGKG